MNVFHETIKIAEIHAERIKAALMHISSIFPLRAESVPELTEIELLWIELLVSRFGKLQDLLGRKLIDLFLTESEESIDTLTMLDKLHKLERLEIIKDVQLWKEMRSVRNHIAHEYPEHPELTAKYLNQIFALTPALLDLLVMIKKRGTSLG